MMEEEESDRFIIRYNRGSNYLLENEITSVGGEAKYHGKQTHGMELTKEDGIHLT